MARTARTTGLKAVALVVAFASLTINFGLIDFVDGFTGYVDQARNQVLDVGWGAVFGVILPLGLLSQLRRAETRIAGIQQTALVTAALAIAGVAGQAVWYLALAGGVAVASAVLLALHPARRTSPRAGGAWSRGCSRSQPLLPVQLSSMPGGWPPPSGGISRQPMQCPTVFTTGP
jgi:hypothetical protein